MALKEALLTALDPKPGDIDDRKMWRMPISEMERRWSLVRRRLQERQIDALIVQGYEDKIGGYVKWFTDTPSGYARTIIFHVNDAMTIIDHGPNGQHTVVMPASADQAGVGEIFNNWAFHAAGYTSGMSGETACEVIKSRGYRRVAVANLGGMPHGFVAALQEGLSGVAEIVDETDFLDRAKAVKSAVEIDCIRHSAAMQDEVFAEVLAHIEPGMRDFEINAFAKHRLEMRGTERGVYIGRSAPMGTPTSFGYRHLQGRTVRRGDHICLLLETNGLGGLWTEMARTIAFGKAPPELIDAFDAAKAAQQETVRLLKPGANPAAVFDAFNAFQVANGAKPERRLHSHGQGYDSVERPLIRSDETMTIEAGFNLAVHPSVSNAHAWGHVCDNWLIDLDGVGGFIHQTPQDLFEL